MTTTWPEALLNDCQTKANDPISDSLLARGGVYPLPSKASFEVEGEQALDFLQGQLSCDINELTDNNSLVGSHNNPKGRMIASFRIFKDSNHSYRFTLPANNLETAISALKKYIVFSKATLTEANNLSLGCFGQQAADELKHHLGNIPTETNQIKLTNFLSVLCIHAEQPAFEVTGPAENILNLYQELLKKITPSSEAAHKLFEHQQGLAFIEQATSAEFIPQMLNYQAIGAVSFTKGCYTGQEIIARTKYLGKLKKQLSHHHINSRQPLKTGQTITQQEDGPSVGEIISAVKINNDLWDVLSVISTKAADVKSYWIESNECSLEKSIPWPYSIDE